MKNKMKKEINLFEFIKQNTIRLEASRRGGGIEIDCSELLGEGAKMTAYQNYLGGGMLGGIDSSVNFKPKQADIKLFENLQETLKKYFHNITNEEASDYDGWNEQSYEQNQNMPKSAY